MLIYILTIIIVVSFLVLIFIIIKKLPKLTTINIESITEEKELEVKNRIIRERLDRKFSNFRRLLLTFFKPLKDAAANFFSDFKQRISELEKEAIKKTRPLKSMEVKQEIKEKLKLAKQLIEEEKLDQAEENYIAIINLDPNNFEAYEGLVQVYLINRDYKKARETSRYCIKLLNKRKSVNYSNGEKYHLASCYADLGSIYQIENKNQLAFSNFKKAVRLEPNNPRFLDFLLKISIILENKESALEAFKALQKADPQNKKLPELKEEIDNL